MPSRKKVSEEPKWQTVEKIVGLLEKALTPAARVEHNVFLPVIGHPDREPRQCDIVVTYGQPPRQTIAIIEVQDRKRRPELNTFHGWITKMHQVGAQHLMCVFALGFPKSIIDEVAKEYGPTVRLMTLKELEEPNINGLVLGQVMIYKKPIYTLEEILPPIKVLPKFTNTEITMSSEDQLFSLNDNGEVLSMTELIGRVLLPELQNRLVSENNKLPDNGSIQIELGSSSDKLYLNVKKQKYEILSLSIKVKLETEISLIPINYLEYKQESLDGTLAWVAIVKGNIDSKEIVFQMVFKQDEHGFLRSVITQIQGIDNLALELYTDEVSWRSVIEKEH